MHLGWTETFGLIGPPYIPFIPHFFGHSKEIEVFVDSKEDSHVYEAPELGLKPRGCDIPIKPTGVDGGGGPHPWYRYSFDIGGYSPDTIEVVFLKKYLEYDLPSVTFIATKKKEYVHFWVPLNG